MGIFGSKKKLIEKQKKLAEESLNNSRKVVISGDIDNTAAYSTIMHIMRWYNQDASRPITIYINSSGGNINSGIAIYDVIKTLLCDVSTICIGSANGLAALLLSAGTPGKRFAVKSSKVSIGKFEYDKPKDKETAKAIKQLIDKIYHNLENESNMTFKQVKKKSKRNLASDDALKYGMVDNVIFDEVVEPYIE